MVNTDIIIELKNVTKIFDGTTVVDNISFYVKKGEFLTFVGPSGCGKTTTLRMIGGFELPTSGTIFLNGQDITQLPPYKRPINTVFQRYALFPHLNVYENVAFGLRIQKVPVKKVDKNGNPILSINKSQINFCKAQIKRLSKDKLLDASEKESRILELNKHIETLLDNPQESYTYRKLTADEIDEKVLKALKIVDLDEMEERDISTLSGGQQQRVAIARAICLEPKILLLDEPLGALDLKMRKDMQIELKEMHKKLGITFIYVTHDQEEALTLSDTIVVMNEGKIQQIGTPTDIYNEPQNSFVADFIGESNILNGKMICDRRVEFAGHVFDCVDEGFGEDAEVDVVIRPEDIFIMNKIEGAQFSGVVKSCTFKGVHYEMFVDSDAGYELMIQDYNAFEVGSSVGLIIRPNDIQVMHKERTQNSITAKVLDETHLEMLGSKFEVLPHCYESGREVNVNIAFKAVDLLDHSEDGTIAGEVHFIIYKGNHYHLTILTEEGDFLWVDTNDIWDKGD